MFQYDDLPEAFRVQVIHIWRTALGAGRRGSRLSGVTSEIWDFLHDTVTREKGLFLLSREHNDPAMRCGEYLLNSDTTYCLDIIELTFQAIDQGARDFHQLKRDTWAITQDPDDAIEELNHRFREHGIGYEFVGGELVRKDSQYIHSEVVGPAIALLNHAGFSGPSEEFMLAHRHYRRGLYKDAIQNALKAFESRMKAICDRRKWHRDPNAGAKVLINTMIENELIPRDLTTHFQNLRVLLEAGLPTVRNKTSGHGQGISEVSIPPYLATYALHLAASNIVLLVEAHLGAKAKS